MEAESNTELRYWCHICYAQTEPEFLCDRCDQYYCEGCSYAFTIHYQHEGARCHWCSDQDRIKPLTIEQKRDNKIKYISLS